MVTMRLAHMPHVSCFSFSIYFFPAPLPSSSLYVHLDFITIPTAFLCLHVFFARRFNPAQSPLSSVFASFCFGPYFPLVYLFAWLQSCPPSLLILSPFTLSTTHIYHPTFHGNMCLLCPPPLKCFPASSSKEDPAVQIIPFKWSDDQE